MQYYTKVERIIVHCEYGQSRSAGCEVPIATPEEKLLLMDKLLYM